MEQSAIARIAHRLAIYLNTKMHDSEASGKKLQVFDNSIISLFLEETCAQRKPNQIWKNDQGAWNFDTVKSCFTDTRLIGTSRDYGTVRLDPEERKPYGHLGITDSSPQPWGKKALTFSLNSTRLIRTSRDYGQFASRGKKALTFSLNSTRLIRTSRDYGQFASTLEKESSDIFSQFSPLILTLSMAPQ